MITRQSIGSLATVLALLGLAIHAEARVTNESVERTVKGKLALVWQDSAAVDIFQADAPDPTLGRVVARGVRTGKIELPAPSGSRPYFFLKDTADGAQVTVAERVLPLERGSNFRDLGGYAAAGGRTIRWGVLFRSGATPLLTDADRAQIAGLGLKQMIDLRSSEERQLAPSRVTGVPYTAVGYSFGAVMPKGSFDAATSYPAMVDLLKPQLKVLFATLLRREVPLVYNCSAGQDRTGIASALVLSALGVPRDIIVRDYLLSTQYRHPEYEMPPFNPAAFPDNAAAKLFAAFALKPGQPTPKPNPLAAADGTPFLTFALKDIEKRWGSVDAYLEQELGVGPAERAQLRKDYTE